MPELIAAAAACVAAVLSGASLLVGGRRDERRWRREAMTDTLVVFLDASFSGAGQRVYDARLRGEDTTRYKDITAEAHRRQIDALTRLRLLAPSEVVLAAERLHEAGYAVHTAVLDSIDLPSLAEWTEIRQHQRESREHLLIAARKALGLGPAQQIRLPSIGERATLR